MKRNLKRIRANLLRFLLAGFVYGISNLLQAQVIPIVDLSGGQYTVLWDGTSGSYFNQAVPNNWALASNGATAYTSSDLCPSVYDLPYHRNFNLNDGVYGNDASWIGGSDASTATVLFPITIAISSFAFGRDNGNATGESVQYGERVAGVYTVSILNAEDVWQDIAQIEYGLGVEYAYRHGYTIVSASGDVIEAKGIRLLTTSFSSDNGTWIAIDEVEVYGSAIPEPGTTSLHLGSLMFLVVCFQKYRMSKLNLTVPDSA